VKTASSAVAALTPIKAVKLSFTKLGSKMVAADFLWGRPAPGARLWGRRGGAFRSFPGALEFFVARKSQSDFLPRVAGTDFPGQELRCSGESPLFRIRGSAMSKEIDAEAALENCRALINQINARLSAEKPLVNASTAAELLFHLELAASALTPTWH
jgi:hypothetical protein